MHVSEQNSFLPFCVGRMYLSGVLFSPHQMHELLLLELVPLLPAELPAVNLRGVLPAPEVLVLPLRSDIRSALLLPLLLVILLLLLPGDELPDADITNYPLASQPTYFQIDFFPSLYCRISYC